MKEEKLVSIDGKGVARRRCRYVLGKAKASIWKQNRLFYFGLSNGMLNATVKKAFNYFAKWK
jgi:hypothetical protein